MMTLYNDVFLLVDATPALVFDNGSGFLKVGYSTDSMPKEVIPSVVGVPLRYSQDISGMEYSSRPGLVFGDMAVSKAGVLHNGKIHAGNF